MEFGIGGIGYRYHTSSEMDITHDLGAENIPNKYHKNSLASHYRSIVVSTSYILKASDQTAPFCVLGCGPSSNPWLLPMPDFHYI
jgi:hypothetical protein